MIKTMLIAPYSGMAESVKQLKLPEDFQVDIEIANLEDAIQLAKSVEDQGYDLIISRGGTAAMIQEKVSIPVIHIDISGYDMLRVFTLIQDTHHRVALVGFENISRGAKTLSSILEYEIEMFTISHRDQVRSQLEELKRLGYTIVIGDVVTVEEAQKLGIRGILITSGKEAILDAFDEGRRQYQLLKRAHARVSRYHQILQSIPSNIILVNKESKIEFSNLSSEYDELVNEIIESKEINQLVVKVFKEKRSYWKTIETKKFNIDMQIFPIKQDNSLIGIYIQALNKLEDISSIKMTSKVVHVPIIGDSPYAETLRETVHQFAQANENILITGEQSTGKMTIAKAIHFATFGQDAPMLVVDCSSIKEGIQNLVEKVQMIQHGTIVFKEIDRLSIKEQELLVNLVQNTPSSFQIISLSEQDLDSMLEAELFNSDLYHLISELSFYTKPLRERKEDIAAFISYFLSEFHTHSGNETLGIRKSSIDMLKEFEWHGNLGELQRRVKELSIKATGYYINEDHIIELSERKDKQKKNDLMDRDNYISIKGTLEEIEQAIIHKVYEDENRNQTKTAKRLGINRTTLWRKLNNT
ncbi:transcriptional regulator (sigma-L-dependent) [Oceanobacillus iheyensis HTE831]|uniref:Transcriptional regulator (Sigma-L-dependent) n=1 Tax=Oceanobacillus iheyensis (strain DSM 14371 / CIP 107618 / JCM 11309 / KCTC 3954 / HTE831) TaxID=221109 RepID=Q8CUU7_OCEIH|nr:sigma-54-dependent Fis family transcriptional regulator [Oceanobacillus iheyensis]BAC12966.1 transcriptional regulator (sigma-L-dependent) [Oceanobacillus iheyensis HTE831]